MEIGLTDDTFTLIFQKIINTLTEWMNKSSISLLSSLYAVPYILARQNHTACIIEQISTTKSQK